MGRMRLRVGWGWLVGWLDVGFVSKQRLKSLDGSTKTAWRHAAKNGSREMVMVSFLMFFFWQKTTRSYRHLDGHG